MHNQTLMRSLSHCDPSFIGYSKSSTVHCRKIVPNSSARKSRLSTRSSQLSMQLSMDRRAKRRMQFPKVPFIKGRASERPDPTQRSQQSGAYSSGTILRPRSLVAGIGERYPAAHATCYWLGCKTWCRSTRTIGKHPLLPFESSGQTSRNPLFPPRENADDRRFQHLHKTRLTCLSATLVPLQICGAEGHRSQQCTRCVAEYGIDRCMIGR